ncbi:MAG: DUF4411 family protein [Firmicutes bacterium]|nr:DUF4411 family protein [Bacillota bacterium]
MSERIYLLDANVFIQAARDYYAFELAPGFWEALLIHAKDGRIQSIDRVKDELQRGNDELKDWVNNDFHPFFASTDQDDVADIYRKIMNWVQGSSQFLEAAKAEFARSADGWLVAYAMIKNCIVVTHEQFRPEAKKTVPIPNICQAFGVPYINTYQMLRDLGVKLR